MWMRNLKEDGRDQPMQQDPFADIFLRAIQQNAHRNFAIGTRIPPEGAIQSERTDAEISGVTLDRDNVEGKPHCKPLQARNGKHSGRQRIGHGERKLAAQAVRCRVLLQNPVEGHSFIFVFGLNVLRRRLFWLHPSVIGKISQNRKAKQRQYFPKNGKSKWT